jgi:hypothetical protein
MRTPTRRTRLPNHVSDSTTQVGQDHAATKVLLVLGTNNHLHGLENAAELAVPVGTHHQFLRTSTEDSYTSQAGVAHRSDRSKSGSLKNPNQPSELQNDPNSKQQQHGTIGNSPERSPEAKPTRPCTGQTGE